MKNRNRTKQRLENVLACDRIQCSVQLMEDMAEDIGGLLQHYADIEESGIRIRAVQKEQEQGFLIFVPVNDWKNTVRQIPSDGGFLY